jgi:hypothetical protein
LLNFSNIQWAQKIRGTSTREAYQPRLEMLRQLARAKFREFIQEEHAAMG